MSARISFVIPTFNRKDKVARAIESVVTEFGSAPDRYEIIVVDDGSADGTSAAIHDSDRRDLVKLITFERNRGLASARNAGVAAATGDWIALLDSDNTLLPGAGGRLSALIELAPADVGAIWAGSVDSEGRATVSHNPTGIFEGLVVIERRFAGEYFSLVRRSLLSSEPYTTSAGSHACEAAFWARLAQRTKFLLSNEMVQYYETSGDDRICALNNRIARAGDFARCYELTAENLESWCPEEASRSQGKAAFYWSISGAWGKSVKAAAAVFARRASARALGMLMLCLSGPNFVRMALRIQSSIAAMRVQRGP